MLALNRYRSHVFDLDGVLLASNAGKSDAFFRTARPRYGKEAAAALVDLHQHAGSITRRQRWERFFVEVLQRDPVSGELDDVLEECSRYVSESVYNAKKLPGVDEYLESLKDLIIYEQHGHYRVTTAIVSGVEDEELQKIVDAHGLRRYMTYVYGGRTSYLKSQRLVDLVLTGLVSPPAVYYGDTQDDHLAARAAKMDFVLITGDSEFLNWPEYFANQDVLVLSDFTSLKAVEVSA